MTRRSTISPVAFRLLAILAVIASAVGGDSRVEGDTKTGKVATPVVAVVPERWQPPQDRRGKIDFASSAQADAWLRHDALGDPSFDNFKRLPGNPIVRGKPPFVWPVNGSLFEDPKSGNWYAYIGFYLAGYDVGPGRPITHCEVYRSKDRGQTWEDIGPIFDDPKFRFPGDTSPSNMAPDASVIFADGRYHLGYDWGTDNSTWEEIHHPRKGFDNGVAYAWSERPEGPFHRSTTPIVRNSEVRKRLDQGSKYHRAYGTTVLRRKNDWIALTLADSGFYFGWGVMAQTTRDPLGDWSDPKLILGVEWDEFFPHTVEAFPVMVHDGYAYASATSVMLNRNFQVTYRAPLEEAHRHEAWKLYQYGTAWHSEYVPNEAEGLWGQTYAGFIDRNGQYQVLFPSREHDPNLGTINLASRPWNKPLRDQGFVLSGHGGPSLTVLRYAWERFQLKTDFELQGGAARIIWGFQAPVGPDRHAADATINPLSLTRHQGLVLSVNGWSVVSVDAAGKASTLASGSLNAGTPRAVEIGIGEGGKTQVTIDGKPVWQSNVPGGAGPIGLLVDPYTNLAVSHFEIDGEFKPAVIPWVYLEALTGAAVLAADWDMSPSPLYRYGQGAVRKAPGGRVKWNFRGRGFQLWSPKGPNYGRCELLLDGKKLGELDLRADKEQKSEIVFKVKDAGDGYHAVVLRSLDGRLVVDSLDALN